MRLTAIPARAAVSILLLLAVFLLPARGMAFSAEDLALDYLVQNVCLNPSGIVQLIDPYFCPAGDVLRSLEPGEALPYHRYDQSLPDHSNPLQRRDSYPVITTDGREIVVNTYDNLPYGPYAADRDGYDITLVRDGWASISSTRTRNEPGITWFGSGCRPYGGWVLFPVSALSESSIEPGEARVPMRGIHWERNGEAWPGHCPTSYSSTALTSWEWVPGFKFGGIADTPVKTIDAIRVIHGFNESMRKRAIGHVEVFYFTRLYGMTRWETWVFTERFEREPQLQERFALANHKCSGSGQNVYMGITFWRTACRDWTNIHALTRPETTSTWPAPG
jgi:hypothetical protein